MSMKCADCKEIVPYGARYNEDGTQVCFDCYKPELNKLYSAQQGLKELAMRIPEYQAAYFKAKTASQKDKTRRDVRKQLTISKMKLDKALARQNHYKKVLGVSR